MDESTHEFHEKCATTKSNDSTVQCIKKPVRYKFIFYLKINHLEISSYQLPYSGKK